MPDSGEDVVPEAVGGGGDVGTFRVVELKFEVFCSSGVAEVVSES